MLVTRITLYYILYINLTAYYILHCIALYTTALLARSPNFPVLAARRFEELANYPIAYVRLPAV
jgi:hypothetical protein